MVQPIPAPLLASLSHPSYTPGHKIGLERPGSRQSLCLAHNSGLKYLSPSLSGKILLKCLLIHGALQPFKSDEIPLASVLPKDGYKSKKAQWAFLSLSFCYRRIGNLRQGLALGRGWLGFTDLRT